MPLSVHGYISWNQRICVFKTHQKIIETKFNREIKVPRSNNGGEYDSQIFFHLISILRISQNDSKFNNITPSLTGAKSLFLERFSDMITYLPDRIQRQKLPPLLHHLGVTGLWCSILFSCFCFVVMLYLVIMFLFLFCAAQPFKAIAPIVPCIF